MRALIIMSLAMAVAVIACGGMSAPTSCSQAGPQGTFMFHFNVISGPCMAPPDSLGNTAASGGPGCMTTATSTSANGCHEENTEVCMASGGPVTLTGYIDADASDWSRLHGELTKMQAGISCTFSLMANKAQ